MLPTAVSLLLATLAALPAQQEPDQDVPIPEGAVQDEGEYLVLKFDETEDGLTLRQFIKVCQINTGRNFTLDDNPTVKADLERKRLLLFGQKRIRKEDFYSFFQIMMKINGFVCVQQGSGDLEVVKIVRADATNQGEIKANTLFVESTEVEFFSDKPGTYITTVVPIEYANATTLGTSLRTALASGGVGSGQDSFMPLQNEGGSALLIQGYGPFVAWAVRLVRILDKEPDLPEPLFRKIPLREASSEEMAQLLQDLIEDSAVGGEARPNRGRGTEAGGASASIPTKIIANARDNSLIVVADAENMEKVMDLVAQLDTRLDTPETNFRVYQLQNISAVDLEEDLVEFLNRTQQAEEQVARSTNAPGAQSRRADQRIVIQSQEETNSLLITATRTKWAELERLLDRLDQRQPQVLIETALIEVSEDFTRDIGIELASVNPPDGDFQRGFGFTSVGISTLLDQDGDNLADTRVPSTSNAGLTAGVLDGADFGLPFLIAAAQNSSDANILSIPSILVTNNRVAKVESTDEIPVTEQTTTQGVGVTETFRGFEEAGIKLEITPSISARKYLRLGINLEISAFKGAFTGGTIPPARVTRVLQTTVYLPDGATMWIGGIIRDDLLHDEQGVPWLSDIPVLGWVFSRDTKTNVKTTLYFFCTPRIMDDFEELADLSELGKSRAAEIIGLDRVRQVDPEYRFQNPLDVILDEDINGDGETETGMLDMNSFAAPVFVASTGFISPEEVGADPRGLLRGVPADSSSSAAGTATTAPVHRNLPQRRD